MANRRLAARWTALALGAAFLGQGACGSTVRGSFRREPAVAGPVELDVATGSGGITVRSGPPGVVRITGKIVASGRFLGGASEEEVRALEQNPPLRREGDHIRLERPSQDGVSIDYEIVVPPDTRLRAETGSGDCDVRGVHADVDVTTGSGDLVLEDIGGAVRASTGSGSVRARRVAGSFDAQTGSGDIGAVLTGPGDVRARTGSGSAEIRGVSGGLAVDTGSGDVVAEGVPRSPWQLGTSSGNVRVRLPRQVSYDVDLSTGSGDIEVGRPVATTVQGAVDGDSHHIAGRVGAGGPLIKVRTGSGDVSIE
jgi:hypothetical protein